jgi:hypothetical protein
MQIGVEVQISVQVRKGLTVLIVPATRLYLASIDEQVSPGPDV